MVARHGIEVRAILHGMLVLMWPGYKSGSSSSSSPVLTRISITNFEGLLAFLCGDGKLGAGSHGIEIKN